MRVIKISTTRCKPCQTLAILLPEWNSKNIPIEEIVLDKSYEENRALLEKYGLRFVPSLVVLDDQDELISKATGLNDIKALIESL